MSMVVKNNVNALNTLNVLNKNQSALAKSLQKVSSGMKINSAADDASGYAISERMRVQIRSLDQANANTQNGSSMMKTAEGAVNSTVEILRTLKEKAINAANDSNTDSDRLTIQKELDQSIDQINDNANVTFNGKYLVDGSKNTKGNATYTALSNQSLSEDTTATTALTALKARNGDSLEIHDTDKVTVSYVQGGKTYTAHFDVKDEKTGQIATLGDIFKKAEEINADDKIFADTSNKSVLAAKVKDGTLTEAEAKDIQPTISTAKDAMEDAKTALDTADAGLATTQDAAKTAIDAYNEKAAVYAGLVSGTTYQAVAADETADNGAYMDSVANSASLSAAITDSAKMADAATAFKAGGEVLDAVAAGDAGKTAVKDAIDDLEVSDSEKSALKNAVEKIYADNNNGAEAADRTAIQNKFKEIGAALSDVGTKTAAMKTAVEATGLKAPGGGTNDGLYKDYTDKKADYETKKTAYDNLAGPAVLNGKTVGLAASNDTVETASGQKAITITANSEGVSGQISGFNISISDSQGNVKKSANAALDAFEETIRAQNKSDDNAITLQVGAKANQSIKVGLTDMRAEALGLIGSDGTKLNISTQDKANAAINVLDNAIQKALDQQTTIGAIESRLEYTANNLTTASENVTTSESTIRDANMAKEMTEFTKNNVLSQAAQSMLAQANQSSSNVLSLLQ